LLVTILGFALHGDPHLQARLLNSALAQFPVIGSQLRENVHAHSGSGLALVVGIVGTLYGCLGAAQATQNALNRAWAVPRNERPNPIKSRLRSLLLVVVLGVGVLVTTGLSGLTTGAGAFGTTVAGGLRVGAILLSVLANIALFMLTFRVLTVRDVPTRHLRLGAVVAAIGWQIVQLLGTYFVTHALKGAREAYGVFGLVLGLIAWIYLLALVTVLAAEINVVAQRHLWPRALLTPFTDDVQLTSADKTQLHRIRRKRTPQGLRDRQRGLRTTTTTQPPRSRRNRGLTASGTGNGPAQLGQGHVLRWRRISPGEENDGEPSRGSRSVSRPAGRSPNRMRRQRPGSLPLSTRRQ